MNNHMKANLDPLELEEREILVGLDLGMYGFTEEGLDWEFFSACGGCQGSCLRIDRCRLCGKF